MRLLQLYYYKENYKRNLPMLRVIPNISKIAAFLFLIIICLPCIALGQQSAHTVKLKTGNIELAPNATEWIDAIAATPLTEPQLVYLHFTSLPTKAQKEQLEREGVQLIDYLPENTYTALMLKASNAAQLRKLPIYNITAVPPTAKIDAYLQGKLATAKNEIELLVTFQKGMNADIIRQHVAALGGQVRKNPMEAYNIYKINLDADRVATLAAWYGVQSISVGGDMQPLDAQSRPAVKGNIAVSPVSFGGYGLTGDSITVGVGDNSAGVYHADLKDRITNFNPAPMAIHGEHVNGIVGSAGNVDYMAEGMAPHVGLVDYFYDQILPVTGPMLHGYNMTLTNNSYGVILGDCNYSGTYDGYSRFLDSLALQYPQVLHVFASGNDGYLSCSPYPPGFGTVGGGYQTSKNIVTVGSITDYLAQASDESRGPTLDGRLKPEITAVGLGAYSTAGVDDYAWEAGTSMAAPQVAGGLAILAQRFKQVNGTTPPLNDELKAILLNGAMDRGNPGPDFGFGFGTMDVGRSLGIIDKHQYYNSTVTNGNAQEQNIVVPPYTAQLKVMLCWNDAPASTSASTQLVNDLDLTVRDPNGNVHLPLVCDPTPANVNNNAMERPDHLNNIEQVTINHPAAGTYAIHVDGFHLPSGSQRYVVSYDIIPAGIQLTYPMGGEQIRDVDSGNYDSVRIFWNAITNDYPFTLKFSANNGNTWTTLADSIPANERYFAWKPLGINSGNCKIAIFRTGSYESATSGRFVINDKPIMLLDSSQCPGYVNTHWKKIKNASYYQLLCKKGPYMQLAGITADTFYSFNGMPLTEKSYVAVQPVIDGLPGYRSIAAIRTANTGDCNNAVSTGDLMIEKVLGPVSGRQYTNGQKSSNDTLSLLVRNLYSVPCSSFKISYAINGSAWYSTNPSSVIPANASTNIKIAGIDLSRHGGYSFTVAITNQTLADPLHGNDTVRFTVFNLQNDTLSLPFQDGFEDMGKVALSHDSIGISPNAHWDYETHDSAGRLRSFANDNITIAGSRSISLDENQTVKNGSKNLLTGTFNLARYDTSNFEIRLDFDYLVHGQPKTTDGNFVLLRPNDTSTWSNFYDFDFTTYPGTLTRVRSLSLTDAMRTRQQTFSTSVQLQFGQNDTSVIATRDYGNGITMDNVKIYTVINDAAVTGIVSPQLTNCGLSGPQPITVAVKNGVNYTLYNVTINYRYDSGAVVSATIDSLQPKATINYTFAQEIAIAVGNPHSLDVWLSAPGDSYTANDSLLHYKFRNNPVITSYPYLENFEAGNGGYYTDGLNTTWQYGTPSSSKINKAASGTKAWKTNLTGKYNNLEQSYLYSPCFDMSSLDSPMLSFSAALDIENCGNTLCDKAYVEYTYDGVNWRKLGGYGQGTNWYDSTFNAWNRNNFTRWHVASIPIPLPVGGGSTINFRFALKSDPGVTFDGFAIDDIHIFNRKGGILEASRVEATHDLPGNSWVNYQQNNQLFASLNGKNQNLMYVRVNLYPQDTIFNSGRTQYTFPRSYLVDVPAPTGNNFGARLYLTEQDFLDVYNDRTCPSCSKPTDVYAVGITEYFDRDSIFKENNTLGDDTLGNFLYHTAKEITWVPYDNGYYAEFSKNRMSECWFNDGGPTGTVPAGIDYLTFKATRAENSVNINWTSLIDTAVNTYWLQRSFNDTTFAAISSPATQRLSPAIYSYTDSAIFPTHPVVYYRLKWNMKGNSTFYYSPVRRLDNTDSAGISILFDAVALDRKTIAIDWTSFTDGIASQYILERADGSKHFDTIFSPMSKRVFGTHYHYTDSLPNLQTGGVVLKYRLTAILDKDTSLTLPVKVIQIPDYNIVPIVFPNPVSGDNISISWYADAGATMKVTLTDIAGKNLYKNTLTATQWSNHSTLNIPFKAKGIYLLNLNINGQTYVSKIVFE